MLPLALASFARAQEEAVPLPEDGATIGNIGGAAGGANTGAIGLEDTVGDEAGGGTVGGGTVGGGTVGAATARTAAGGGAGGEALDWTTYKGDPQRTSARAVALPLPLSLMWRHSATDEAGTATPPLVVGPEGARRIFFAAGPNTYCIDGETGSTLWRSKVLARPVSAPLLYVRNAPGQPEGMIVAVTSGGQISALRANDGGQIWTAEARAPIPLAAPTIVSTPRGERLVVALATGQLIAYTLEGTLDTQWRIDALNPLSRVSPNATPALSVDGTRLFLPAQDQKLYCINVATAKVEYSVALGGASNSSPLVLGDQVVVAAGETVTGYRVRTGDPIWRVNTGGRQISASPAGLMDAQGRPVIYIGARNGVFFAIEGTKGQVLWKVNLGEAVTGTAAIATNAVVVGTSRGVVFALNPADGTTVWQYRLRTERPIAQPGFGAGGRGGRRGGGEGGEGFGGDGQGGGGGGQGFGGRGGFAATAATQVYGVTAPPVIAGGQAYLMGDNVAVYCFDTQPFDSAPPRVVEPGISVPSAEGTLATLAVQENRPQVIPGKASIYFAAQIDDAGSGLDPTSLRALWNNTALPADRVQYSPGTSVLTVVLNERDAAGAATNLADGTYTLALNGRDYAGNALTYTARVQVDNAAPPPSAQQPRRRRRRQNNGEGNGEGNNFPGGEGFPGGQGFPGGGGGGFPGGGGGGFPGGGFPQNGP
jgi:outer membrane protein assembly factor BamB